MKRTTSIFILSTFLFLVNSCKKDDNTTSSSSTPEELLTKSLWKINEIRYSQVNTSGGGATYYYKRGTTGNVSDFDNENILFAANNTGTFTLGTTVAPITWQFTDAEKTKIQWVITYSPGNTQTVYWENVKITATNVTYGEYYTTSGGITSIGIGTHMH
jgi:hypothetical protein